MKYPTADANQTSRLPATKTPILLDGAIGTELQRRGAPMDPVLWSAIATLSKPDILAAVHRDYVAAGCDVITANTYICSKNNVLHAGRGDDFAALNAQAIRIARRVSDESDSHPLVAGSVSTMPPLNRTNYVDKGPVTTRYFAEQIKIIEDEGADLLLLEMLLESESACSLLEACDETTLPVWAGLSASLSESTNALIGFRRPNSYGDLTDEPFEVLCRVIAQFRPDAMGVMHTRPELLDAALESLRRVHDGPAFAYPNVGHFEKPTWVFPDETETDSICRDLIARVHHFNLSAVGGCCGTTPGFIRGLKAALAHSSDKP